MNKIINFSLLFVLIALGIFTYSLYRDLNSEIYMLEQLYKACSLELMLWTK